ncbi:MAG: hypothetical protein Q8J89_12160 [Caulobacter sp.]|nr:hypothetical protein [Caulobacter sp.]
MMTWAGFKPWIGLAAVTGIVSYVSTDFWSTRILIFAISFAFLGGWLALYLRKINRLRTFARVELGDRFSDEDFDRMLSTRPFGSTLAYAVEQWIASRRNVG